MMRRCIWCRKPTKDNEPIEHIVGEGLVGDRPFDMTIGTTNRTVELVLANGEVCGTCNRKNGRLDENLVEQFGFARVYWNSVGTKRGTPATAAAPGMFAIRRPEGPHIVLNSERYPVTTDDGITVGPAREKDNAVRVTEFSRVDDEVRINLSQPFRVNKRFSRGLHKIAFELLCHQTGPGYVLDRRYDAIRDYVLHGRGNRRLLVHPKAMAGQWEMPSFTVFLISPPDHWAASFQLLGRFTLDLSPTSAWLSKLTTRAPDQVVYEDGVGIIGWDTLAHSDAGRPILE